MKISKPTHRITKMMHISFCCFITKQSLIVILCGFIEFLLLVRHKSSKVHLQRCRNEKSLRTTGIAHNFKETATIKSIGLFLMSSKPRPMYQE